MNEKEHSKFLKKETTKCQECPVGLEDVSNGRRWLVLVMSTLQVMFNGSVNLNVGILNLAVLESFQAGPLLTSWLMSVYVSLSCLAGPVTTAIIDLWDSRVCVFVSGVLALIGFTASSFVQDPGLLFLTLGIASLGQSMSLVGGSVVLPFYFPRKTALVSGIYICGSGLGSFIHPPLTQHLVDVYSLNGAFLMLGAISFHSSLAAMFLKPHPTEKKRKRLKASSGHQGNVIKSFFGNLQILGSPAFCFFMLSNLLYYLGVVSILVYLPQYLVRAMAHSDQKASKIVSLVGLGVVVSRLCAGFIANDSKIGERVVFFGLNILSAMVCCLGPAFIHLSGGPHAFSFAIGLYSGGSLSVIVPISLKITGTGPSSLGIGLCFMAQGLGILIGAPLGAQCILFFGYDAIFYFTAFIFFLCAATFALSCVFWADSDTEHRTYVADKEIIVKEPAVLSDSIKNEVMFQNSANENGVRETFTSSHEDVVMSTVTANEIDVRGYCGNEGSFLNSNNEMCTEL